MKTVCFKFCEGQKQFSYPVLYSFTAFICSDRSSKRSNPDCLTVVTNTRRPELLTLNYWSQVRPPGLVRLRGSLPPLRDRVHHHQGGEHSPVHGEKRQLGRDIPELVPAHPPQRLLQDMLKTQTQSRQDRAHLALDCVPCAYDHHGRWEAYESFILFSSLDSSNRKFSLSYSSL